MFELLKVDSLEARRRIVIAGWGLEDKGPSGFVQMDNLLEKGSIGEAEKFNGPLSHETALLCYSSGTTGKPKGVEVCRSFELTQECCIDIWAVDAQESWNMRQYD